MRGGGRMGMTGGGGGFGRNPQFFSVATPYGAVDGGDGFMGEDEISEGDLSVQAQNIEPLASVDDPQYGDIFGRGGGGGGGGHGGGGRGGGGFRGGRGFRGRGNFPFFGGPWGGGWGWGDWGWGLPYEGYFDEPEILFDPLTGLPAAATRHGGGWLG